MKLAMEPVLKTQMELEAHEKEVLSGMLLSKRSSTPSTSAWRLEAMIKGSTILVVAMVVTVFMGIR